MSDGKKFCSKCGAPLPENAAFCSNCGTHVATGAPPVTPFPGREHRYEKQEKGEKGEKGEKKEKGEKGRGDVSGPITGGLVLIWLGVSFFLAQSGRVAWANWWQIFLIGLGAILILQGLIRYSQSRRPVAGPLIGGVVVLTIGLVFYSGLGIGDYWPLILVVLGAVVLVSALAGRRRVPSP